jgi:hypothetical protein
LARDGGLDRKDVSHQEKFEVKTEANQEKVDTVVEPYKWAPCVKATHVLTALQGWACNVLHGAPKGATYKETIRATED